MNHSEFWSVVERVFGSAYGRALTADLALADLDYATAEDALAAGIPPQRVWLAICVEMDLDENLTHYHRVKPAR